MALRRSENRAVNKRYIGYPQRVTWGPEDTFVVEYIVATELQQKDEDSQPQWMYFTKWDKWPHRCNTWEPKKHFSEFPELITEFWAATPRKTEPCVRGLYRVGQRFRSNKDYQEARSAAVMDEDGSSDTSEPQSDERDRDVAEQVDTSEDETMVQTSEEVDSSSKPVIRLPKARLNNIMSMTQGRIVDPQELMPPLKKSYEHHAAYTNISPHLPNSSPRKLVSSNISNKKCQSHGKGKQVAIRSKKQSSPSKTRRTTQNIDPDFMDIEPTVSRTPYATAEPSFALYDFNGGLEPGCRIPFEPPYQENELWREGYYLEGDEIPWKMQSAMYGYSNQDNNDQEPDADAMMVYIRSPTPDFVNTGII